MRGDQRGRGTQLEYDRKGKYSLSSERQFCPDRHILFQGDCLYIILYVTLRCSNDGRIWQYDNSPTLYINRIHAHPSICEPTVDHLFLVRQFPILAWTFLFQTVSLHILTSGRSRKGGASMPGRERCPTQTGRGLCMRGDQRGRGTQLEYDRKGKYSLYLGNEALPNMPYSVSG